MERYRLFAPNNICEDIASNILHTHNLMRDVISDQKKKLEIHLKELINSYCMQFIRDNSRTGANLESIFCQAEQLPHGSLSWFYNQEINSYFLLLSDGNKITDSEGRGYIRDVSLSMNGVGELYQSLLVPPQKIKKRSYDIFWNIDKLIGEKLTDCDTVIIVGWSMPDTDIDCIERIKHIVEHRTSQICNLIICDIEKKDSFYSRFESLFRPKNPISVYKNGFCREFISSCFK
ncbi:MAG: hypothetical protein ABH952_00730 [Candidatus Omnitrophota bacterium]